MKIFSNFFSEQAKTKKIISFDGGGVRAIAGIVFLKKLEGRRHRVITSISVKNSQKKWQRDVISIVKMKRLSKQELDGYLTSGDLSLAEMKKILEKVKDYKSG